MPAARRFSGKCDFDSVGIHLIIITRTSSMQRLLKYLCRMGRSVAGSPPSNTPRAPRQAGGSKSCSPRADKWGACNGVRGCIHSFCLAACVRRTQDVSGGVAGEVSGLQRSACPPCNSRCREHERYRSKGSRQYHYRIEATSRERQDSQSWRRHSVSPDHHSLRSLESPMFDCIYRVHARYIVDLACIRSSTVLQDVSGRGGSLGSAGVPTVDQSKLVSTVGPMLDDPAAE